jgi:hypothetical protein
MTMGAVVGTAVRSLVTAASCWKVAVKARVLVGCLLALGRPRFPVHFILCLGTRGLLLEELHIFISGQITRSMVRVLARVKVRVIVRVTARAVRAIRAAGLMSPHL